MFRLLAFVCLLLASASALVAPPLAARPVVAARAPALTMKTAALNKAARLSNKRRLYNRAHRSEMRTAIKRVRRIFARCPRRHAGGPAPRPRPPPVEPPSLITLPLCSPQVLEAVQSEDYAVATPALSHSFSSIDKNVKRGIMHKNTAARKKSQLALKVKALEPGAAAAPAAAE